MDKIMSYSPSRVIFQSLGYQDKISKISAGATFSAAITISGKIFVWGNGEYG